MGKETEAAKLKVEYEMSLKNLSSEVQELKR